MPKTGKPDSYWSLIMYQYAQGKFSFGTGKKPGSKKWKTVIKRISECPLTPIAVNLPVRHIDIFGRQIPCQCGYHKTGEQTSQSTTTTLSSSSVVSSTPASATLSSSSVVRPAPASTTVRPTPASTTVRPTPASTTVRPTPASTTVRPTPASATVRPASASATVRPTPASTTVRPAPASSSVVRPTPASATSASATLSSSSVVSSTPASATSASATLSSSSVVGPKINCSICGLCVDVEQFNTHLADFHAEQTCDQCGKSVRGVFELLQHIEESHQLTQAPPPSPPPQQQPSPPPPTYANIIPLRPPAVDWTGFLPKQFLRVLKPADREWIAQCLYEPTGQLRQNLSSNWFHPPSKNRLSSAPPDPNTYFRQRMFVWAPMRMWGIPMKCSVCKSKMHHSGIYTKVREVIDLDSRYYLVGGDYPRCSQCKIPVCPWSSDILSQLDPAHRNRFPAVLTTQLALDRKCVTMLRPRTAGNSSSYMQQALEEVHSEEWARRSIEYLSDCALHKRSFAFPAEVCYEQPPPFVPLPLAQWFETVHANDILCHLEEMKGVITSTYGRILKLDSTKKITKKLAGGIADTATWMTNVSNECGQVLNCVLTTGEGAALDDLCQGIVKRYQDAGEPEPLVMYVDRDCCSGSGPTPVQVWFRPWNINVKLDIFHFMRRFSSGLTTEHHPLFGTFCSKLSSCIFEWDQEDICKLKDAKRSELKKKYAGLAPSDAQVLAEITSKELARHCRRRTRGVEETRALISTLLHSMWDLTDTTGLRLVNPESMERVWANQQKHLPCIQDPPGVELYTRLGAGLQKGDKVLDVLKCGRGSSSLESFHRHQCTFIPGWRCNATHTQMYMLEGGSRWNINRAHEAVDMSVASQTRIYDVRLMSNLNEFSRRVLGCDLLPEFVPPGKPTGERIAVEYLLHQTDRGDLLATQQHAELGVILPDLQVEVQEEEWSDVTISAAADIVVPGASSQEPSFDAGVCHSPDPAASTSAQEPILDEGVFHGPHTQDLSDTSVTPGTSTQDERCDTRGVPGWELVDALAKYLADLNRTITALSTAEVAEIVRLYSCLYPMDKTPAKFSHKSKKTTLPGPWRASRKRSGSAPGQQAAERLFMTHGQAAQSPDMNRISECVCIRLLKEYQMARNRSQDIHGKTLPIPQSIVSTYSHIKQLLEDSQEITHQTNLLLVNINNTTVSSWLYERQKRTIRGSLLQATDLPHTITAAKDPLPKARDLPPTPVEHGHTVLEFQEPENQEGEAVIRQRSSSRTVSAQQCPPGLHAWPGSSQPPPAPSPAWSSDAAGYLPPTQSPAPFAYQQSHQPPAPSPALLPYQQGSQPPGPYPGWSPYAPSYPPPSQSPAPFPYQQGYPPSTSYPGWSWLPQPPPPHQYHPSAYMSPPPQSQGATQSSDAETDPSLNFSRHRKWRLQKAAMEDQERVARGEQPKKRHRKEDYHYQCKTCGHSKSKSTGHTQVKGRWYCPASGLTVEEWKESLNKQQ